MAETLRKGTKEWLIYDVTDRLGTLSNLVGTAARYDVYDTSGSRIITQSSLTINVMEVYALIDTTGVNFVPNATLTYKVYLQFDTGPESPYLFGGEFLVAAVP